MDLLLIIETCKYGFVLLSEAEMLKGQLSRMFRSPVDSSERSEFKSAIGDTVYKDDDLPETLRRSVKHLRLAIQEYAYTLERIDLKKLEEMRLFQEMNAWSRKVNGKNVIVRDELGVVMAAFCGIQMKHDELKRSFLEPEPSFERAPKVKTLPPNRDLAQLLTDIRGNIRDVFYMSYIHLDKWTTEMLENSRELLKTAQWKPHVLIERLKAYKKKPTDEDCESIVQLLEEYTEHYYQLLFPSWALAFMDPKRCYAKPGESSKVQGQWSSIRTLMSSYKNIVKGLLQQVEQTYCIVLWSEVLEKGDLPIVFEDFVLYGLDLKVIVARNPDSLDV